ncbi:MAG: peptidoglycan bridge formation glycyltransferase FemA/FemB family protein [Proteobacteria bacterium]|nr:peptidoglycan bridge formation glycyltransferase FemA/FemB family protein [Pseudomonadota bacterium]
MVEIENYKKITEIEIDGSILTAWISPDSIDSQWDSFVESASEGRHEQLSLWSQVKSMDGWNYIRVVITDQIRIIGGFQLLWIPKRFFGRIAYVSQGPVIIDNNQSAIKFVIEQLKALVKKHKIRAVIVQPACHSDNISVQLLKKGFLPNILYKKIINTTLQIDLGKDEDELLKQMTVMNRMKRRNIRKSEAAGIEFREGCETELDVFFNLMSETCKRQGVLPNPPDENHLKIIWRLFNSKGYLKLFFIKYKGEPVSGGLAITVGDRFIFWKTGWSGKYNEIRPNDAIYWNLIKYANTRGYRYIDFVSIDRNTALYIKQNKALPQEIMQTSTFFKMGFGGNIVYLPEPAVYIPSLLLSCLYHIAFLINKLRFFLKANNK